MVIPTVRRDSARHGERHAFAAVSDAAPPIAFCLHVPRCAGTTIERFLAAGLEARYWQVQRRRPEWALELLGGRIADHTTPRPPDELRALSGHWLGRSLEALFPRRRIIRTVLLREPRSLILSWYNFRMGKYRSHGHNTYGFDLHLTALSPDPVTHFLLQRWLEWPWPKMLAASPTQKADALDAALARFDYVEDVSACFHLVRWLQGELGVTGGLPIQNATRFWARVGQREPLRLGDLPVSEQERLTAFTRLDDYLWRRWAMRDEAHFDPREVAPFARHEPARMFAERARRRRRFEGITRRPKFD